MILSPFYIEPRKDSFHLDLNGKWSFTFEDKKTNEPDFNSDTYIADIPKSTYLNLYEAGLLPHPYECTNSEKYLWVREKVWYYKKTFFVDRKLKGKYMVLCFDGLAYYSKIWLNGVIIGDHEGMFGGPFVSVGEIINFGGENRLIVEITAPSYGDPDFTPRNINRTNTQIVPWCAAGDEESGSRNFMIMGIWRGVRIEFLNPKHISRPVMSTVSIDSNTAELKLEAEIIDGIIDELNCDTGINSGCYDYTRAYDNGLTGEKCLHPLILSFEMAEKETGNIVLSFDDEVYLSDRSNSGINPSYYSSVFFEKTFVLNNPKLWFPHTMGDPFLYEVRLSLYDNQERLDMLTFDFGIRTVKLLQTPGGKYRHRWGKFQFEVNGKKFFLKGMNSMPVDFLYRENREEIKWTIETAKNAGIELLRIWNGGGYPESDTFYNYCNQYGILVWQDWFIANTEVPKYPQDVLEEQMMLNLYRIRNNPSLAVHCGGNEFNPYAEGNAAAMFVIQRSIEDLDPQRPFMRTTADGGSAHIYCDIEPIWFQKSYKDLPFVGESGIHSFPNISSLKRLIPQEEYELLENRLPDLFDRSEMEKYPAFLAHFVEYNPDRIPRMIARASTVTDVKKHISLSDFAEATQIASYEFYQMMIFSMRDNYPVTAGIMPWVFKRPWTTVGIQLVDGMGYPIAPYYAVKNAYSPLAVMLRIPELVFAPEEEFPVTAVIFNDCGKTTDAELSVKIFSPEWRVDFEYSSHIILQDNKSEMQSGSFKIPAEYSDSIFIVTAEIKTKENTLRTVYWPRCLKALEDEKNRILRRSKPCQNPIYNNGPWLKETVISAGKTSVIGKVIDEYSKSDRVIKKIRFKNTGSLPAFPVCVASVDSKPYYVSDNYFLLEVGEEKEIILTVMSEADKNKETFYIFGWNFDKTGI